ncbi:MAG: amino acid adenylation domain-containing protein, partial [Pseudomonadota bacterium]
MKETATSFVRSPQQCRAADLIARDGAPVWNARATIRIEGEVDAGSLRAALDDVLQDLPQVAGELHAGPEAHASMPEADVSQPRPLYRIEHGAEATVLHLEISALSADTATLDLLVRALAQRLGPDSQIQDRPDYARVARWTNAQLSGEKTRDERAFWARISERKVPDLPTALRPSGAFRPAVLELDAALPWAAKAIAPECGVDPETILLTAWAILAARIHGESSVTLGVVFDGRSFEELEPVLGPLARQLPIEVEADPIMQFGALSRKVADALSRARDAQDSYDPVDPVPSAFAFERSGKLPSFRAGGLVLEVIRRHASPERFQVKLAFCGDSAELHYDAARVPREAAEALAHQLRTVLEHATPGHLITAIDPVGTHERTWQDTLLSPAALASEELLLDRIDLHFSERPDQLAVVDPDNRLSYRDLDEQSCRVAQLIAARAGPGSLIAIVQDGSAAFLIRALAVMRAGCAWLPIHPDHPIVRVRQVLAQAKARLALVDAGCPFDAEALGVETLDPALIKSEFGEPAKRRAVASDLAYVMPTSGSTGAPKLVAISHGALAAYARGIVHALDLPAGTSAAAISSFAADLPLTAVMAAFWTGGRAVVSGADLPGRADALARYLRHQRPDLLKIVPSQLEGLLTATKDPAGLLPTRFLVLGGEAPNPALLERINAITPECRVHNHYGPTEATIGVATCQLIPSGPEAADGRPPVGLPLPGVRIQILDQQGRRVPAGATGELCISGATLAMGYLGSTEATEATDAAFVADPSHPGEKMYRSGDLARLLPTGLLQVLGRRDGQVKLKGVRIELGEVEAALRRIEGVAEGAAVVHRADGSATGTLVAWVLPASGTDVDEDALRRQMSRELPREMTPARFAAISSIPRLPSGKIDRRTLSSQPLPLPATLAAASEDGRLSEPERLLAGIWCDVLGVGAVARHDSFFELGGDSIQSVTVVARARRVGVVVTVRQIFEHPTIAGLSAVAEFRKPAAADAVQGTAGPAPAEALPLTPNQAWMLDRNAGHVNHFNQALRIGMSPTPDQAHLDQALTWLIQRHEALRLRLDTAERLQRVAPEARQERVERIDVVGMDEDAREHAIVAATQRLHTSLDVVNGPLLLAALVTPGAASEADLLIVVHHVAVDAVSWRVLLEELHEALDRLAAGLPLQLPAIPVPWSAWVQALDDHRRSVSEQAPWWRAQIDPRAELPGGISPADAAGTVAEATSLVAPLANTATGVLLRWLPQMLDATAEEVILATIARAVARALGRDSILVDVEAHGREPLPSGLDPASTVGWMTARFPLAVSARSDAGLEIWIEAVRRGLRATPEGGRGWGLLGLEGHPVVSFTYFGRISSGFEGGRFTSITTAPGMPRDPQSRRSAPIEIMVELAGSDVRGTWNWNAAAFDHEVISACADEAAQELALLARRVGPPSDLAQRIQDVYELGPMQQGILLDSLAASHAIYVSQTVVELRGPLDPDRMTRAWCFVLDRHSALRTGVLWEGLPRPVQFVAKGVSPRVALHDLRDADDVAAALDELLARDRDTAYSIERPPLMRVLLVHVGDEDWRMVWSRHHVMLDGWSAAIVLREAMAAYAGDDELPELPAAPAYGDWIRALRREDSDASRAFWQSELDGALPSLLANADRTRGSPGEQLRAEATLDDPVFKTLDERLRADGLTPVSFIQALWALLLSDLTGRRDVVFGVTSSGRHTGGTGVESVVGLLINTLPLRTRLDPDLPMLEQAREMQQRRLLVEEHHASSLIEISRSAGVGTLFDTIIVAGNYPIDRDGSDQIGGLELCGVDMRIENSLPLTLRVIPGPPLMLQFLYDSKQFEKGWIHQRLADLSALVRRMCAEPGVRVGALRKALSSERIKQDEGPLRLPHSGDSILDLLAQNARRVPEQTAIVCNDEQLGWAELQHCVEDRARRLSRSGVRPGDIVALLLEPDLDLLPIWLAINRAGGCVLPLDVRLPQVRLADVLEDVGARFAVATSAMAARLTGARQASALHRVLTLATLDEAPVDDGPLPPMPHPQMLGWAVLTSGSTGRPKAVGISHLAARTYADGIASRLNVPAGCSWTSPASIAVDLGYTAWLGALATGGTYHVMSTETARDPAAFAEHMTCHAIDCLKITPSHLEALLSEDAAAALPRRALVLGGEPPNPRLIDRCHKLAPDTVVFNHYGPTETTVGAVAGAVPTGLPTSAAVPLGTPLPGVLALVLDEDMYPVPTGSDGELCIAGPTLAQGYLAGPAMTAERFVPDPHGDGTRLYRTGDRVRRSPDGTTVWLGRLDDQIKLRGYRVEPAEIEAAICAQGSARQACVALRNDETGRQRLVAYAVGSGNPDGDVLSKLAERLPDWMIPAELVWLDALPLTPGGKVDRKALPALRSHGTDAAIIASNDVEEALLPIWRDVLGIE